MDIKQANDKTQKPDITTKLTPMEEMDLALKACKFGRFHVRLLFTVLIAYQAGVQVSNTTAYILSSAECDLNMNLVQKGFLNAAPYVGMLFSSIAAGFLTDTFGRKRFLIIGYGGVFIVRLISGTSQSYVVFATCKVFEGALFAISFNPQVTLTSEYCHKGIRDRVMLLQTSFPAVNQIVLALITWAILIQDWSVTLFDGYLRLNTWNFYLYICSVFPLLTVILYYFIPESPKFLLSIKKYDEARDVLIKVYKENTGKAAETYPYYNVWRSLSEDQKQSENQSDRRSVRSQIAAGYENIKPIFQKPLSTVLALICCMHFLSMLMYNVIRLWYPQLSTIIEHYSVGADSQSRDLCTMLDTYTEELKTLQNNLNETAVCISKKSGTETYINSIILGCVCLVPYLISGILASRVGKKALIFSCALLGSACTFGLRWSKSKAAMVALFSTDVALTQTMTGLYQNVIVEFFPTTSRTLAVAFLMVSGRVGTLVGNVLFPILLKMSCVIPFFTLASMLLGVTFLAVFLPRKKK